MKKVGRKNFRTYLMISVATASLLGGANVTGGVSCSIQYPSSSADYDFCMSAQGDAFATTGTEYPTTTQCPEGQVPGITPGTCVQEACNYPMERVGAECKAPCGPGEVRNEGSGNCNPYTPNPSPSPNPGGGGPGGPQCSPRDADFLECLCNSFSDPDMRQGCLTNIEVTECLAENPGCSCTGGAPVCPPGVNPGGGGPGGPIDPGVIDVGPSPAPNPDGCGIRTMIAIDGDPCHDGTIPTDTGPRTDPDYLTCVGRNTHEGRTAENAAELCNAAIPLPGAGATPPTGGTPPVGGTPPLPGDGGGTTPPRPGDGGGTPPVGAGGTGGTVGGNWGGGNTGGGGNWGGGNTGNNNAGGGSQGAGGGATTYSGPTWDSNKERNFAPLEWDANKVRTPRTSTPATPTPTPAP